MPYYASGINLNYKNEGKTIAHFRGGRPEKNRKDDTKINEMITAPQVRVVDANGEALGVISLDDALNRADAANLDLVEVSPNAEPPVCKILDYGKYKFQMQKRAAEARKNQVKVVVKEVTMRPQTEEHDYQIKLKNILKFLGNGDKAKVSLRFRGREITHKELGKIMLDRVVEDTKHIAKVDQFPRMEGRLMVLLLSPIAPKTNK